MAEASTASRWRRVLAAVCGLVVGCAGSSDSHTDTTFVLGGVSTP